MLLVMATIVSLAYAHIHCYLTVDDLWACYSAFLKKQPTPFPPSGQPLWHLDGCGHVVGYKSCGCGFHTINANRGPRGSAVV